MEKKDPTKKKLIKSMVEEPESSQTNDSRNKISAKFINKMENNQIESELSDVLNCVKELDRVCDFTKCKTKTNLVGTDCGMCRSRYCLKHSLPEIHGCGELVKKIEREQFIKPTAQKTVQKREENVEQNRKKIQNKLKEMNLSRKPKATDNKKNKK